VLDGWQAGWPCSYKTGESSGSESDRQNPLLVQDFPGSLNLSIYTYVQYSHTLTDSTRSMRRSLPVEDLTRHVQSPCRPLLPENIVCAVSWINVDLGRCRH